MTPVEMEVLETVHRWTPLQWRDETLQPGMQGQPLNDLHHPNLRTTSVSARGVVSTASHPSWYSPNPGIALGNIADLELYKLVQQQGPQAVENSWLSLLLNDAQLILQKHGSEKLYCCLRSTAGTAALGWPMLTQPHDGVTFYKLQLDLAIDSIEYIFINRLDDWQACTYEWVSFLHLHALGLDTQEGIWAKAKSGMEPLVAAVARKAFHRVPKTGMVQVARLLGVEVDADDALLDLIMKCVIAVLPGLSEDELLTILKLRTQRDDVLLELLEQVEGECIAEERDEQKDLEKTKTNARQEQQQNSELVLSFKTIQEKVRRRSHSSTSSSSRTKKNQLGKSYPKSEPNWDDADALTAEALRPYLPPDDSRLYKDPVNRRWQLFWPSTRRSRSNGWVLHGVAGAAHRCLNQAWEEWQSQGGFAPPYSRGSA